MTGRPRDTFYPIHAVRQAYLEGTPLASFRARLVAFLIDGAIVALILLAPQLASAFTTQYVDQELEVRLNLSLKLTGLLGVLVSVGYFGLATYIGRGATIGKWITGVRVVSLVHERLSLWHSIERALGYAASSLEAGFGFLQYFTHPNRQTVHDRIAETIVVTRRASGRKART